MSKSFSDALLWHMERYGPTIAELARGSGVSAGAIKMLRKRAGSGASTVTGTKIASYYGKTLEAFLRCEEMSNEADLEDALKLLYPDERQMILHQIRGLLAGRSSR